MTKARLGGGIALAMLGALALAQAGCGNTFGCGGLTGSSTNSGFSGCSGGQSIPPPSSINFAGTLGTSFIATVSDTIASYSFRGNVPLKVVYVNNKPPVLILATNLSPSPSLLSVQALSGFTTTQLASTSTQGSTISLSVGGPLPALAGPAACDVRFVVSGPINQNYEALLEQNNNAYENLTTAPTLYLVGGASGNVDGVFTEVLGFFGPIKADLVINGVLADTGLGNSFTVKSGCP
ncbi:MAG TPA: hypothetical protein VKB84_01935 [Candidatus Binataceae bacterium]|nr:hypothetical protein [Candidatus Binataceae bacterium]